jgi:hypothetical protein
MKEEWSVNTSGAPDEPDIDIVSLLKRLQQQIAFLERKIDLLISQSRERQSAGNSASDRSFRKKSLSKPFRSFDQPQRQGGKGEYGHNRREGDSAQGHFYEHRPGKKGRGAGPGKRPFPFRRKDRE